MTATMFAPDLGLDPEELTREERVEAWRAVDALRSQAEALELRLVAAMDAHGDHGVDGALTAASWLARRADLSRSAASAMVKDAAKLRRHPASLEACGELGTAKVRALIRVLTPRIEDAYTEAEPLLLRTIRPLTIDDTIVFAKRWAMLVDENGSEPPEQKQSLAMGRSGDALHGSFTLYGADAATLANALDHEADAIYRSEGEEHLDPTERRAEALLNLIRKALGADDRTTNPARPTVIVHMSLEHLEGRAGWRIAEVDPYGVPISEAAVRRLLCDADIHRVITGPEGIILDLGRAERLVKDHQRLALIARDHHCRFPGCDRPPAMCHGHHIVPWDEGGPTDMDNLVLLCNRHHRLVHRHDGFTLTRLATGHLEFRRPDGSILEPSARPG